MPGVLLLLYVIGALGVVFLLRFLAAVGKEARMASARQKIFLIGAEPANWAAPEGTPAVTSHGRVLEFRPPRVAEASSAAGVLLCTGSTRTGERLR